MLRWIVLFAVIGIPRLHSASMSSIPAESVDAAAPAPTSRRHPQFQQPESNSQTGSSSPFNQLPQYFWMCPSVECPPVSDACETIEFLVYDFQYRLPAQRQVNHDSGATTSTASTSEGQAIVTVRCESCPYCVDRPEAPRSRTRSPRSAVYRRDRINGTAVRDPLNNRRKSLVAVETALGQQCRPVESCPSVSTQCRDVRLTRVLFNGEQCRVPCPACYDTVLIPDNADTAA